MGGCTSRTAVEAKAAPKPATKLKSEDTTVQVAPALDPDQAANKKELQASTFDLAHAYDLRHASPLPPDGCVYIQSGDPGDVDGYLIAVAGARLEAQTKGLRTVIVVPERRACPDRSETDTNKHDQAFSDEVLQIAWRVLRALCPTTMLVRGPLNAKNIIPLKFIFSEPEQYGPLLSGLPDPGPPAWQSVQDLAATVSAESVQSVVMDMNGAMGYLPGLLEACPVLGPKLKASGLPICIMAGILAEHEAKTLRVPGRDPRATMNALYDASAVRAMLQLAADNAVPLLFVTNNLCNEVLRYDDGEGLCEQLGLTGLLKDLALKWYGPHLHGKCVPFDWVSFVAMLLRTRAPGLLTTQSRQLYVGEEDAAVLVLVDPALPRSEVADAQLDGTKLWGDVDNVVAIDKAAMVALARACAAQAAVP